MRPKSTIQREERLTIRLFALEKQAILLASQKAGLVTSDFVRKACLEKHIKARLSQEELALYKLLIEYRNNFSRISNLIKEKKQFQAELAEVIQRIDEQLKKFA